MVASSCVFLGPSRNQLIHPPHAQGSRISLSQARKETNFESAPFDSDSPTKVLYAVSLHPMRAIYPAHFILWTWSAKQNLVSLQTTKLIVVFPSFSCHFLRLKSKFSLSNILSQTPTKLHKNVPVSRHKLNACNAQNFSAYESKILTYEVHCVAFE